MKRLKKLYVIILLYAIIFIIVNISGCDRTAEKAVPIYYTGEFHLANQLPINREFGALHGTLYHTEHSLEGADSLAMVGMRFATYLANTEIQEQDALSITSYSTDSQTLVTETQTVQTFSSDHRLSFLGFSNNYCYYWISSGSTTENGQYNVQEKLLYAYSLSEKRTKILLSYCPENAPKQRGRTFFDSAGTLYVMWKEDGTCIPISNGDVGDPVLRQNSFQLGDREYAFAYNSQTEDKYQLCCYENQETHFVALDRADKRYLLPVQNGLIVFNEGYEKLLYLIRPSGEIQVLFSIPCTFSDSVVNIWGDYVFLSVERFEKYVGLDFGLLDKKKYEDDTLSGSYKINIKTGEAEKCSDALYDGLTIFGDSGMIGTKKDGSIVQLDFDFQEIGLIRGGFSD